MTETELPDRWAEFLEKKHRSGPALEVWKAERRVEVLFCLQLRDTEGDHVNSLGGLEAEGREWVGLGRFKSSFEYLLNTPKMGDIMNTLVWEICTLICHWIVHAIYAG